MADYISITRYSDADLEEFRAIIQKKLEKAQRQLAHIEEQLAENEEVGDTKINGMENALEAAEKEQLTLLAARHKKHIQHLENALVRIQNKVYGICRATGELISKERLKAVPHATLSIKAKEAGDQK